MSLTLKYLICSLCLLFITKAFLILECAPGYFKDTNSNMCTMCMGYKWADQGTEGRDQNVCDSKSTS